MFWSFVFAQKISPKKLFHRVLGFFRSFWPFGTGNYQRMRRKLIFRHLFLRSAGQEQQRLRGRVRTEFAEEANTAFFWCLGILLTRLAQKPQENETLLQQTKFFTILFCLQDLYFPPFWRQSDRRPALCGLPLEFMFAVGNVSVLSNRFVVKSLPP